MEHLQGQQSLRCIYTLYPFIKSFSKKRNINSILATSWYVLTKLQGCYECYYSSANALPSKDGNKLQTDVCISRNEQYGIKFQVRRFVVVYSYSKNNCPLCKDIEQLSLVSWIVRNTSTTITMSVQGEKDFFCCGPKIWTRAIGWLQLVSVKFWAMQLRIWKASVSIIAFRSQINGITFYFLLLSHRFVPSWWALSELLQFLFKYPTQKMGKLVSK